jgi:hypothetical protein
MGLCAVLLGVLTWAVSTWKGSTTATGPVTDALRAGSQWDGRFRFLPPYSPYEGDVSVAIRERSGDGFRGVYTTEGGQYEWHIEGTVKGSAIRWWFTKAVREPAAFPHVGKVQVEGKCEGEAMEVLYRNPEKGAAAEMKLRVRKELPLSGQGSKE